MYSKGVDLPKDHKLYISKEDFEKRVASERELEKVWELGNAGEALPSLQFDQTSQYLIFGSMIGVKIMNIVTNKLSRLLGKDEQAERFLQVASY